MQKKTPFCENKRTTQKEKGGKLCTPMNNEYDKDRDFPPQGHLQDHVQNLRDCQRPNVHVNIANLVFSFRTHVKSWFNDVPGSDLPRVKLMPLHICCDESQKPDLVLNLNSVKDSWTCSDC